MSRSLKKGPYIDPKLAAKVSKLKAAGAHDPIKTWSRRSTISPDMVTITFLVYNGKTFIKVYVTDEMVCKQLHESSFGNATDVINTKELEVDVNKLRVVEARVDPGPIIKRWRASSQRRPTMIKKRLCHVIFTLEERDVKESRPERAKRQKQERQRQAAAQKAPTKKEHPPSAPSRGGPSEGKPAAPVKAPAFHPVGETWTGP